MVAIRQEGEPPPFVYAIPKEYEMPTRDGPIWPVSVNMVRATLQRSRLDTLRKPDIAIAGRSDRHGWVRYSVCVAESTYRQFDSDGDLFQALIYAFCEPISDWCVDEIDEGYLISFTLYVNHPAARSRKRHISMQWEAWAEKFR